MDNDFFRITLKILDKHYPYNCKKRSDERILRKAATNLTEKYLQYSSYYSKANFEKNDLLTLVGFHFSFEVLDNENKEDTTPLFDKIEQLNNELEDFIRSFPLI
jgi:cell division protein ZapA